MAGVIGQVPDDNFTVVLDPSLSAQDVVDAGGHFVPFKVIPKTEREGDVKDGSQKNQPQMQWAVLLYMTRRGMSHTSLSCRPNPE